MHTSPDSGAGPPAAATEHRLTRGIGLPDIAASSTFSARQIVEPCSDADGLMEATRRETFSYAGNEPNGQNGDRHNPGPRGTKARSRSAWRNGLGIGAIGFAMQAASSLVGVSAAHANSMTVCAHGCRFHDIAPAIAAAAEGDTITVGPGLYPGGLTLDKSIQLVGAGASRTIISGGGPVIMIGVFGATSEPTVTIRGVTITGGISRTSPISVPFTGSEGIWATGGGVEIPPGANFGLGATTTIIDSVITGNRVAPSNSLHFGPECTDGCLFAGGAGGGIDNWGNLTLIDSTVSNNRVGTGSGLTEMSTQAEAGAIEHWEGDLTLVDSTFEHNTATVTAPNGRYAGPGAIFVLGGTLTMHGDAVRFNTASVDAALPDDVDMGAGGGGVHVAGGVTQATLTDTKITDNTISMTNAVGYSSAFSGGLHTDINNVILANDDISRNNVISKTLQHSSGNASGDSGAGEISGTVTNTQFNDNSVTVQSVAGDVSAGGGAMIFFDGTLTHSTINNNHLVADSPHSTVTLAGGGLITDGNVTLKSTSVNGNNISATAISGTARGGGIFDAPIPNGPQGGQLVLTDSTVTRNSLTGSPGVTLNGGGIFTAFPVNLTTDKVTRNSPDQCAGCS